MASLLNISKSLALDYLASSVLETGYFVYRRNIESGLVSTLNYNLIRHAGCTLALLEATDSENTRHGDSALRALNTCLAYRRSTNSGDDSCLAIVENGTAKLGATALCLAALVEQLKIDQKDSRSQSEAHQIARAFGNHLLAQQDGDGRFQSLCFLESKPRPFESLYYPGEAILALTRLAHITGLERYLDGARKGATYLAKQYVKREPEDLPADHWLMLAIGELDFLLPDELLRETVVRLGEAIAISATVTDDESEAFWGPDARLCPAATRAEGLGVAVKIALRIGHSDKAFKLLKLLEQTLAFCLSCQVNEANSLAWPNAQVALGGFRDSWKKPLVRIDYVQHGIGAINALLGARRELAANI